MPICGVFPIRWSSPIHLHSCHGRLLSLLTMAHRRLNRNRISTTHLNRNPLVMAKLEFPLFPPNGELPSKIFAFALHRRGDIDASTYDVPSPVVASPSSRWMRTFSPFWRSSRFLRLRRPSHCLLFLHISISNYPFGILPPLPNYREYIRK